MDYRTAYSLWKQKASDPEVAALLEAMDEEKQKLCFDGNLSFGTAGMRAEMDAGTNRMNVYTVARATMGLANYLVGRKAKSAAVSFDSRLNSERFAKVAAAVFASKGLKVYLTAKLQPTPVLSFMVRRYAADCGVMITASHNTKQYNGYKVYGADGAQINEQTAKEVLSEIEKVDIFSVDFGGFDEYLKNGFISYLSGAVIREYVAAVLSQNLNSADGLTVAYSALNGTGCRLVPEVLQKIGAKVVKVVEQAFPNGNFTTCPYPNPEREETLALGIKYAAESKAQLLLATDPDCDRVGAAVLHDGKYVRLSGNEVGFLLTEYILATKRNQKALPHKPVVIKTIVTSCLTDKIVSDYGGETVNLLTGFKYIGEYMTDMSKRGVLGDFVFAFEESCGYLAGAHVRDKDGVVASMLIAEMCAEYRRHGATLVDRLNYIYKKYGRYHHKQITYRFSPETREKISAQIGALREKNIVSIGGLKVLEKIDLLGGGMPSLPRSDVLIFNMEAGAQIIFRPSGTEPILKIYLSAAGGKAEANLIFDHINKCTDEFFA